jgi:hypothetical protein
MTDARRHPRNKRKTMTKQMTTDVLRNFEEIGRDFAIPTMPTLQFSEGKYLIDKHEVDFNGTRLVANMPTLRIGWVRQECGYAVKEIMGLVSEGFQPPMREEIGDFDKALWETDKDGIPQDPWHRTQDLVLWDIDNDQYEYQDTCYRLVLDSTRQEEGVHTGEESLGILCQVYAAHARTAPDEMPMIELAADSWTGGYVTHPKTFHFPKINLVGWYSEKKDLAAGEAAHDAAVAAEKSRKRRRGK